MKLHLIQIRETLNLEKSLAVLYSNLYIYKDVNEFKHIQPIIKKLHEGLSEENRTKGYEKALRYKGWERPILIDFNDLWYIMYIISNYRVEWIDVEPTETRKEIEIIPPNIIDKIVSVTADL